MSEEKFDVIIVGAGLAGCTAALVLARQGLEVVVVERGCSAGAKNMTGGRLYAHTLEPIIPGFATQAPVERCITREKISMMTADSAMTVEYQAPANEATGARSYSVLRATFDPWLMQQAEAAGAALVSSIRVDELIRRDGIVAGVKAGGEELLADVVILADGVNSLLAESIGLAPKVTAHNCAVGVKEVIELGPKVIQDRFGCGEEDGTAWLFAGSPSDGLMGGGFLYTNRSSVSLGVVFGLHHIEKVSKSVPQMLEDFKSHPAVAPLIEGGTLLEYSAHVVPEGGMRMMPTLVSDGVLVSGDAAGMCLNLGFTIRGMDLAIASGRAAAEAVIQAKQAGNYKAASLGKYTNLLETYGVLKDMKQFAHAPEFVDTPRMFREYPALATGLMSDVFTVNGPAKPVLPKVISRLRQVGLLNLAKDAMKGVRAL
jgi:electron transfer flavoprotein-quinone oxidoreductase